MRNPLRWLASKIQNFTYARDWGREYGYDILPPENLRAALDVSPFLRHEYIKFSRAEADRNPYYSSVLNKLADYTIGPSPSIIGFSDNNDFNDNVEDVYSDWIRDNSVARSYRQLRREAALTGIGILIPYKNKQTEHAIKLSYKCFGADSLRTPPNTRPEDRIIDGIQYDEDWEPERFYLIDADIKDLHVLPSVNDVKEYTIDELIYWCRGYQNGRIRPIPECYAAFTFYPYIRRFLQATIEGEEFKASFPLALEVDPTVYPVKSGGPPPYGSFTYEPRSVKTLPVGTKMVGFPAGMSSSDRDKLIRMFAGACALTVDMPNNIALGDSSNSNMASSQVDTQPWANKVEIDRFDLEPVFRRSFRRWWSQAVLKEGLLTNRSRIQQKFPQTFPHLNGFTDIHSHPDPAKRANARMTDLISGATTLNRIYTSRGMNVRRELARDAEAFGLTLQELMDHLLVARSTNAFKVMTNGTEQQPVE